MKRVTYISRQSRQLSASEIAALGAKATSVNRRLGVTGVLMYSGGVFYQIIEGPTDTIDTLYARITRDERHRNIFCLKLEEDVEERAYPDWAMRTINLDEEGELLMAPLRDLMNTLARSHGILERYTQPTVAAMLARGVNPLYQRAEQVRKIVLFSDIVRFNQLTSSLDAEDTLSLVNAFFGTACEIVTKHGGVVSKLIGDCLMACFAVEDGDHAVGAGVELLEATEVLRGSAPASSPLQALYCGVGLDSGVLIEGNIGSHGKKDFTVIGEAANHAAWIESLTRRSSRCLLFSASVQELLSSFGPVLPMGAFATKHGESDVHLYSVETPATENPFAPDQMAHQISKVLARMELARSRNR